MTKHVNFYENVQEARMRLRRTIVLYDGVPHYIHELSDHKGDGKIRAYIEEIGHERGVGFNRHRAFPDLGNYPANATGAVLDQFIDNNPSSGVLRKELGSPKFNKFRPFPIGNVNVDGKVVYVERTPTRNTLQGLSENSIIPVLVSVAPDRENSKSKKSLFGSSYMRDRRYPVSTISAAFKAAILNDYPTAKEVIEGLNNPNVLNEGVAFSREFSVFRGPLDFMFLCYKHQGVGLLDRGDLSKLTLGSEFRFLAEQLDEMCIFQNIAIKEIK